MAKKQVDVLVVGANASQHVYGVPLLDTSLPADVRITFYDRRPMAPQEGLTTVAEGVQQGRVKFVTTFPKQHFHIVIVAVATEHHVSALQEVLLHIAELPALLVLEKPLGVSMTDLLWYRSVSRQLQQCTVVNEPNHFMGSVDELLRISQAQPVTEVNVWSYKTRRTVKEHGGLRLYAIEFPHLHGAACRFAGQVLDASLCQVNNYYRHVQGRSDNDAIYTQFTVGGVMYTVAQGLGSFTIDRHGAMSAHNNPPRTRRIRVNFANSTSVELDLEPAYPAIGSKQCAAGVLHFYDSRGKLYDTRRVPDNPRRFFAQFIVQRALQPSLPLLEGVGLHDSLARNEAVLGLWRSALVLYGRQITL